MKTSENRRVHFAKIGGNRARVHGPRADTLNLYSELFLYEWLDKGAAAHDPQSATMREPLFDPLQMMRDGST